MANEIVLIIEDDPAMLRGLKDNFVFAGYDVRTASDGEQGLSLALDCNADLIVLDLMLPKINGYEICRRIRQDGMDMPVIMLTAKGEESDIILGLNIGADDYVTKPFSIQELLARSNAFLRRGRILEQEVYQFGRYRLELGSQKLLCGDDEVELTPKEMSLLSLLVQRPGRALTRDEILRRVWGFGVFVTRRSVDRCVNTLRKKIEPDPAEPVYIKTVRQIGYRFESGLEQSHDLD